MEHESISPFTRRLDSLVHRAAAWCEVRSLHAFGICWGLTIAAAPVFAAVGTGSWRGGIALWATLVLYLRMFVPGKRRILPDARRKLVIDFALFVGPMFVGACLLLGLDVAAALGGLCLAMPFGVATLRLGCFFAGCCHGTRCSWGPRYRGRTHRVAPLPLLEALVGCVLLAMAIVGLASGVPTSTLGATLLGIYASYRFCSEFFRARGGSFRVRRFAGLSLTQWMCAAVVTSLVAGMGQ